MALNIRPALDRLIVLPAEQKEQTVGGIILPGNAQEKTDRGEVVAVGNGRYDNGVLLPAEVAVGDTVIYAPYGGVEFEYEGTDYVVLRPDDIIAIEGTA